MSVTTIVKTPRTVVDSVSRAAASAATRGTLDLRTKHGGLLTLKITNSGVLGVQCEGRVLVAHTAGATPSAASAGSDWKTLWSFGGGVASGVVTEQSIQIDAAVMHVEVEFVGNTTNACVVEAYMSEITSFDTV